LSFTVLPHYGPDVDWSGPVAFGTGHEAGGRAAQAQIPEVDGEAAARADVGADLALFPGLFGRFTSHAVSLFGGGFAASDKTVSSLQLCGVPRSRMSGFPSLPCHFSIRYKTVNCTSEKQ
jgi:hypothetical protein